MYQVKAAVHYYNAAKNSIQTSRLSVLVDRAISPRRDTSVFQDRYELPGLRRLHRVRTLNSNLYGEHKFLSIEMHNRRVLITTHRRTGIASSPCLGTSCATSSVYLDMVIANVNIQG